MRAVWYERNGAAKVLHSGEMPAPAPGSGEVRGRIITSGIHPSDSPSRTAQAMIMAAQDTFHPIVKTALQKEGWTITDDPLHIRLGGIINMYIDLGAEKVIAAEKAGRKIAVEIKSFLGASTIAEFHLALGQFMNYRYALEDVEPDRVLYLAVPLDIYEEFFTLPFIQSVVRRSQLNLLIYAVETEEIVQWQP